MLKFAKLFFLLLGFALLGVLIANADLGLLWRQVSAVGPGVMALVMLIYACYFGADALSWQVALPAVPLTPRWIARMYVVRMIGEAYNNITPTASLGGEPIKAFILKSNWGVPLRDAGASLVIAKTASMFALVVFVAIGVVMLSQHPQVGAAHKAIALGGLAAVLLATVVFFLMQRLQLSSIAAGALRRSRFGRNLAGAIAAVEDIDRQFEHFYSSNGPRLTWSFVLALTNWVLGVVEIYVILHGVGYPVSFGEAWMIECMVQLVRTMTFFIPAGLGTQEGALLVGVGALTGVATAGLAAGLVRRFRDLIWIGLSLALASYYSWTSAADSPPVAIRPARGASE